MGDQQDVSVTDNRSELRYELHVDGTLAGFILYRWEPEAIVLIHTDVDPAFQGRGLGARLVGGALDDIRARGLFVAPLCPFVASFLRSHPDYAGLVVDDPAVSD